MSKPKSNDPQIGYRYQLLTRNLRIDRAYEHCDYAVDRNELRYLLSNYRLAYGPGWEFKAVLLPSKYWPKKEVAP